MGRVPVLNGQGADFVLKGAVVLLFALIVGVGILAGVGKPIPPEYTSLIAALLGLIAGSRVVPPDVSARIKREPKTDREREIIAAEDKADAR
jgi:membrane-associated protease RseP (regulator of RpoE activity)